MNLLKDDFIPHPIFRTGRLQTIATRVLPAPKIKFPKSEALIVPLQDGDAVSFVIDRPEMQTNRRVYALFHGLGGCADSRYNLRLAEKLNQRGSVVARFNHRGCGKVGQTIAKKIYHSGSTEDLLSALINLVEVFPNSEIYPIGFSLSGAILLNLLARENNRLGPLCKCLKAALAICPPLDLEKSSSRLASPANVVFDQYFAANLRQRVRTKERDFPELGKTHFPRFMKLRHFDQMYTAKRAGFKDRADYYKRCSPAPFLKQIKVPTVILAAKDDPVVCPDEFKIKYRNPNVKILLTKRGGHVGYYASKKTEFGDRFWMDAFVLRWVESVSRR